MKLTFRFPYWAATLILSMWGVIDLAAGISRSEPAGYIAAIIWLGLAAVTAVAWRRAWTRARLILRGAPREVYAALIRMQEQLRDLGKDTK